MDEACRMENRLSGGLGGRTQERAAPTVHKGTTARRRGGVGDRNRKPRESKSTCAEREKPQRGEPLKSSPRRRVTKGAKAKTVSEDYPRLRALSEEWCRKRKLERNASPSRGVGPRMEPQQNENTHEQEKRTPQSWSKGKANNKRNRQISRRIRAKPRHIRHKHRRKRTALRGLRFPAIEAPNGNKCRSAQAQMAQQMVARAEGFKENQQRLGGRLRELWRNKRYLRKTKHAQAEEGTTMNKVVNTTGGKRRGERLPNLKAKELYRRDGAKSDRRRRELGAGKRARRKLSARQVKLRGRLTVKPRGTWRNRAKITTKSSE